MYFFKQDHKDFIVDVTGDMKQLADIVLNSDKTGAIILGGGISKHHIIGANILRDGLDFAVYVCTAPEFDGSLSGAQTREAKSWGKIKEEANSINVNCDATIAFPLMAAALKDKKLL
jgi:deoxyhypusine synthase